MSATATGNERRGAATVTRDAFPPGTRVRVSSRNETPRRALGTGTVRSPEGPLADGTMVLVAMPPFDWFPSADWWFCPEQVEPLDATPGAGGGDG